jgi:serine/threonine protein kinase
LTIETYKINCKNNEIIAKIHDASDTFCLNKELEALKILINFENNVKCIYDFSCMDKRIIMMEYIENGDLCIDFFDKNPSKSELQSVFLQIALAIAILGFEYKISHRDLHYGNILLDHTDREYIKYKVRGKEYIIKTYGYLPKLLDFGQCRFYDGRIPAQFVMDDIYFIFYSMSNWTKDPEYKKSIDELLQIKIKDIHTFMATILKFE